MVYERFFKGYSVKIADKEQLFANEVMLLPYHIAALNIEHAFYERTRKYEAFEGLCFVDTLDLAEEKRARNWKDRIPADELQSGNLPWSMHQ